MEEDQTFQYTQFPNLHATHEPSEVRACLQTHWHGRFLSLPDEVLILAWASLLKAFTRVSTPVFLLNGQPINVDIVHKEWIKVKTQDILQGAGSPSHLILLDRGCDIVHNEESKQTFLFDPASLNAIPTSLGFQYDFRTGNGLLSSSGNAPASFLGELERQFLQMIILVFPQQHEKLPQSIVAPASSVINSRRKFLEGPLFLHELISRNWQKTSTAIDFLDASGERVQISYVRLNYLTDGLARKISSRMSSERIPPSDFIIPVYMPQCLELYCACIAILKANAAFCPIGLDMPHERLKYILEDVGAEIILTLPDFTSKITQVSPDSQVIEVQKVQRSTSLVNGCDAVFKSSKTASPDSLAYVMYTSGSTGVPKGVAVPHSAVTQALLAHDEHVPKFDRFLQFAAPTFDVSVFEMFFPWFRGATLVSRHREHMLGDLPGTLTLLSIDAAELTPTVAGTLLRSREAAPCLRLLLTIGEMLTRTVVEEFAQGPARNSILLPMYGPTEASIHCTLAPSVTAKTKVGIIGQPLSTVTSLVIREVEESSDVCSAILPIGQVGELAVAGQLATGYLNRDEQTKASFKYHQKYGRVYRTGDRVRLLPSGDLECLGRISAGQVKIRGQRVELEEIEQVVCKAEGIQSATARIIDGILVAFCVTFSEAASRDQILSVCKLWLPSFMRPSDIVLLDDDIPRLASGKIDKGQLEANYRAQILANTDSQDGTCSQVEHRIINCIAAEMSKVVRPSDNLWLFGLDSLRAIKLASRLRENGLWLSVSDILEAENVAALAQCLKTATSAGTPLTRSQLEQSGIWDLEAIGESALKSLSSDLDTSEIEAFRPCSPLQIAMLVETSTNSSLNFNSIEVRLPDRVSKPSFYEAFQTLAHHNRILRSGFVRTSARQESFCQLIWKKLDVRQKPPILASNGRLGQHDTAELAFLRPLRLHFAKAKEGRVCTIHIHHALYDGWSVDLMLQDLEQIILGQKLTQRPQFDDVLIYQLQLRLGPTSDKAKQYWQDHLKDIEPTTFPSLLTKQIQRSGREACVRALTLDLRDLTSTCRRLHVSRQSVVSAIFAILLSSYTGNSDVVFGAVSSGRTMPIRGIQGVIGPCVSTFPMRLDSSKLRTIKDVINSTHRQYRNLLQFDGMCLWDIKRLSGIAGGDPLFDSLFVWQEGPESLRGSERLLTITDTSDSLVYDVVLEIEPRDGKLQAKVSFATAKLSATHAMLFLAQLDSLLTLFVRAPETLIKDCYHGMNVEEISVENEDFRTFDQKFTLTSTIDALASQDPSRIAIEFVDAFDPQRSLLKTTTISYGELYRRSSHVSQVLATKGALPNTVISIMMEKSVELYIAILGVIRSGAAYLAIDPRTPPERVRKILEDSHCRTIISEDLFRASTVSCESISMSELERGFQGISSAISPSLNSQGGNLAYVVYTSGSTGVPKGVLITRSNVLSNIDCLSRLYPSSLESKLLQACSQAFDVSVFEIFFTWHMGMSLCIATNDMLFRDMEYLIRRTNVSHLSLTPSVAALIEPENVPNVRFLVTAGEPMNSRVFNSWIGKGLYQGYGPSETTNICNVRAMVSFGDFPNNVGPPLPNTSIFICQGDTFSIVPKGAVGKIWIGGEQVGRGYLYNDYLTSKSFIEHATYGRLYCSGDIGRILSDGSLVIVGRDDDQVKLRGQRIELGDINQAIISSTVVQDAVTLIVHDASNDRARLVSFWTRNLTTTEDAVQVNAQSRAILTDLEARMPAYMIPEVLIPIDHIPLTGQGKVDRKTMIEQYERYDRSLLDHLSKSHKQQDSGALSQYEAAIAHIMADVVNRPLSVIHRDVSFFALGLDSIKSIRVSQRLRDLGFAQVDVSTILRYASVGRLATHLSSLASASAQNIIRVPQPTPIARIVDEGWQRQVIAQFAGVGYRIADFLHCTPLQEVMLSSYDLHHSDSYRNEMVFHVNGDSAKLRHSWKAMLSRHQLLRTGFATTLSSAYAYAQVVLENFTLPWTWENSQTKRDPRDELRDGCMLPPYSLEATRGEDGESSSLTLRIHHALYDGEAIILLLREVEMHYLGEQLPPVVPFDRYLEYMLSLEPMSIDRFWRSQLDGYTSHLVAERFRPAIRKDASVHLITNLVSRISFSTLKEELQRTSINLLALVQTSWARLLSFYLRTFDVCFGNVYSGRSIPVQDVNQIIGPCFNTLPVRVELKRLQTILELSRRLQEVNTMILPFQPSSLRRIQKNHGAIERPLFDTLLLLQPSEHPLNSSIWTLIRETGDMNVPVICEIVPDTIKDQLRLKLHVQGGHLRVPDAHRLLDDFDTLLQHDLRYTQGASQDFSILEDKLPLVLRNPADQARPPSPFVQVQPEDRPKEALSSREMKISRIISDLSKTEITKIRKRTSIFQLGLDSINAVQIAAKLRQEGFSVTGGEILEASSIEGITELCSKNLGFPQKTGPSFDFETFDAKCCSRVFEQISVPRSSVEAILPCTPAQSGILAEFIHSDGRCYFNSLTLRLNEELDANRLKDAWSHVVSRHEMLRTGFVETEDNEYPFAMVTYRTGIYPLPWRECVKLDDATGCDVDGKRILESFYKPPWCLLYGKQAGHCQLQLSFLHALCDAQSLDLILADVGSVYHGVDLPPPRGIQHKLSSILSEKVVQVQESMFFFKNLRNSMQPTRFPDLRIYSNETHDVSFVSQSCTKSEHELRQGCRKAEMSLQTAIHCAWAQLLTAYTGDPDVTFGVVFSGRTSEAREKSVAFPAMNTLPMPLHVKRGMEDLIRQASRLNAALMQRQFVPLTQIKKWLDVKGSLFDTVIVLQQYHSCDRTALWEIVSDDAQTEHAVSLEVVPSDHNSVTLRLTFQRKVMPSEQAKILLCQFEALLYTTIFRLRTEERQPLGLGCELFSVIPAKDGRIATSTQFLHEMVERSAHAWPEKIALEFATGISNEQVSKTCWTYQALENEANKIGHLLIRQGALPGDMIGICFEKCPEASFAILGILKAGCAFVALDPNAPEARKVFILKDSGCKVLLCDRHNSKTFERMENPAVLVLDNKTDLTRTSFESPKLSRELKPEDTCYCLYTSGTTGQPKGCLISHDNVVQALLCFQRIFAGHWDDDSRWLQFASFHFDVSVLEHFWSWSVGICVTSAPRDLLFEDLPAAITALQITHLDLTPSLAGLLKPEEVPSLCRGVFITGGEQLRQDVIEIWGDIGVLYNFYGPSEVTIGCTVRQQVPKTAKPSNIGQQFDNIGTFVLDLQTNQPVLRGAIGELCVSGPLVGKGYLNRPELTEARFEYRPEFGVRIYHTGDLVRLLHDGSFEFLGRSDDQVKLRGQRLEIAEINHVLTQANAGLRDVATMVTKHPKQTHERLVSFLSWSERSTRAASPIILQDDEIKALVAGIRRTSEINLPEYMVPTYLIPVSVMPLSANNKVDLNVLKSVFASVTVSDLQRLTSIPESGFTADQSSINKIIGILSKKLGIDTANIMPSSSLFELGIDSISVIGFSRSLKDAGFNAAQPALVMRHSTIAGLAIALQARSKLSHSPENLQKDAIDRITFFAEKYRHYIAQTLGISDESIEKVAPCTPLQEGMISKTLQTDNPAYASTFTYDLSDRVNLHRLQESWLSVQSQTDILRTIFIATDDGFAQVVLNESDTQKCFIASGREIEDAVEESEGDLDYWYNSIKVLQSIPWKVILKERCGRKVMVIHIFHALFDGISLPLLLESVAQNYFGKGVEVVSPGFHEILPFGPLRAVEGAKSFWQECLASKSLGLLDLPIRYVSNAKSGSTIKTTRIQCLGDFDRLRVRLRVTMPALFHACWLLVLHKHFGTVPTLGIVVSGRSIDTIGAQNVIGPMFNTLPCLIEFGSGHCTSDLVEACHEFHVECLPFQHTALRDISKWIGHDLSRPLFDSLFVFQKEAEGLLASSELWTACESASQPNFPLALEVQQNLDNSFRITVAAHEQYLDTDEVQTLIASFENAMCEMLEDPNRLLPVRTLTPCLHDAGTSRSANTASSAIAPQWMPEAKLIQQEVASLANTRIEAIRADSTIFEVGLDSIDAIKLSARLKAVGMSISVSEVIKAGTIEAIAEVCIRKSTTSPEELSCRRFDKVIAELKRSLQNQGVAVDEYEKVLPATPLQEGMLINFEQYCTYDVLELEADIDISRLRKAWENVVSANPVLRTSFVDIRDPNLALAYAQLVHRDRGISREAGSQNTQDIQQTIDWHEVTVHTEPQFREVIRDERQRMIQRGIEQSPLNLTLVRLNIKMFLLLGMAHTIYDGWSVTLLHDEVQRWYNGITVDRPSSESSIRHILDGHNDNARRFWSETLTKLSPSLFPRHVEKHSTSTSMTLSGEIRSRYAAKSVQDFCKAQGVTAQALGLTCHSIVLAGLLEQFNVCTGLVLSGRTTHNFDEVMFPTMNTVIFSTSLSGSRRDMLKDVHDHIIEISEHQFFPLRKAKALCAVEGAVFDALFIYQKRSQSGQHYPQLYHSVQSLSAIEYAVNVEMEFDGVNLLWRAACKNTVLNKEAVSQILADLDRTLEEVMRQPNEPVVEPLNNQMVTVCGIYKIKHPRGSQGTGVQSISTPEELNLQMTTAWSALEETIREVLVSVSGFPQDDISKETSLFSLGLDSINLVKVSSLLRKKSISLGVSMMLSARTVEAMAAAATRVAIVRPGSQRPDPEEYSPVIASSNQQALEYLIKEDILPNDVENILPVTAGQHYVLGVWFASGGQLFSSNFFYKCNDPGLTAEKLNIAWIKTVRQFPILRTTFIVCGGQQILQVQMRPDTTFTERSSRSLAIPVKLSTETSSSGLCIKLSIHHALYDAVSLPVIISTLKRFCCENDGAVDKAVQNDGRKRRASSVETELVYLEKSIHSLDESTIRGPGEGQSTTNSSSSALNAFITSTRSPAAMRSARAFWVSYLAMTEDVATEQPLTSFAFGRAEHYRPKLVRSVDDVEKTARDHNLSFHSLFLAASAFVYANLISPRNTKTVTVGIYLANRSLDIEGLLELVHPVFNVVPLRIKLSGGIFDVAQNIQDDLGRISQIQNCGVSLEEIYEWVGIKIDCCINFLKLPEAENPHGQSAQETCFEPMLKSSLEKYTSTLPAPFTGSTSLDTSAAFVPSVDIEASVRDGGLDVGIFAFRDSLNDHTAVKALEELQSLLSTVS